MPELPHEYRPSARSCVRFGPADGVAARLQRGVCAPCCHDSGPKRSNERHGMAPTCRVGCCARRGQGQQAFGDGRLLGQLVWSVQAHDERDLHRCRCRDLIEVDPVRLCRCREQRRRAFGGTLRRARLSHNSLRACGRFCCQSERWLQERTRLLGHLGACSQALSAQRALRERTGSGLFVARCFGRLRQYLARSRLHDIVA